MLVTGRLLLAMSRASFLGVFSPHILYITFCDMYQRQQPIHSVEISALSFGSKVFDICQDYQDAFFRGLRFAVSL